MGNYDNRNYIVNVKTKWDFSDQRIVSYLKKQDYDNFLFDDYSRYLDTLGSSISSNKTIAILNFIVDYNNGVLIPDKYGAFEPLKYTFNPRDFGRAPLCLSEPSGELYLKKRYIYEATITNHSYGVIGHQDTPKSPFMVKKPVNPLPGLMGEVKFWFYKGKKPTTQEQIDFYAQLMWDLKNTIEGEEGYVSDEESGEIIAQFKNSR